jgi:hypothetical protein
MSHDPKTQCCERDLDHDGNCDVHPAVTVHRTTAVAKVNPEAKAKVKDGTDTTVDKE